ncbi:hypothetical protein ABMA10_02770 [Plantibacter sp. RU18]
MGWKAWILRHRAGNSLVSRGADPVDFELRRQLAAVDSAYDDYTTRMQGMLGGGTIASVGFLALVGFMLWVVGSSPNAPTLSLSRVDDGTGAGVFAILATVVVAIQLSARAPVPLLSESADAARRRFLSAVAAMLVPVAIGMGIYMALPALAGAPETMDLVRVVVCPAGGFLVALFAADAAMAHDDRDEAVKSLRSERWRAELRARVLNLSRGTRRARPAASVVSWAVVCMVPLATGIAFGAALGRTVPAVLAGIALAVVCGLGAYSVVYDVYVNAARNTWSYLSPTTMLTVPVVVLVCATAVLAGLEAEGATLRSVAALGLASILMLAAPAALAVFFLGPACGPRRIFRHIALRSSVRALLRAIRVEERRPARARMNKLARAALWLSLIFPFGIVLGGRAKAQIAAAGADNLGRPLARGRGLATTAQVVSWSALGVPLALLVAVIVSDPGV